MYQPRRVISRYSYNTCSYPVSVQLTQCTARFDTSCVVSLYTMVKVNRSKLAMKVASGLNKQKKLTAGAITNAARAKVQTKAALAKTTMKASKASASSKGVDKKTRKRPAAADEPEINPNTRRQFFAALRKGGAEGAHDAIREDIQQDTCFLKSPP